MDPQLPAPEAAIEQDPDRLTLGACCAKWTQTARRLRTRVSTSRGGVSQARANCPARAGSPRVSSTTTECCSDRARNGVVERKAAGQDPNKIRFWGLVQNAVRALWPGEGLEAVCSSQFSACRPEECSVRGSLSWTPRRLGGSRPGRLASREAGDPCSQVVVADAALGRAISSGVFVREGCEPALLTVGRPAVRLLRRLRRSIQVGLESGVQDVRSTAYALLG